MNIAAALLYWVIVTLWAIVLVTVLSYYIRNPRIFGTTRLLLVVVAIDTARNIVENIYFGLFFGGKYGLFPVQIADVLGNPTLLIIPKLINVAAVCVVLGLLLMHWLPKAITERGRSEQIAADLETLATVDGQTSLTNRRHFDELALKEWQRFQRYGRPLSILLIDVDQFKSVNDRLGHDGGDLVLKLIANSCQATKRETDIVARIGGDEFAILLPETEEASAAMVAERLRDQIHKHAIPLRGDRFQVSVSIGVAGASLNMSGFEVLFKDADKALYRAKRGGRNKVVRALKRPSEAPQAA